MAGITPEQFIELCRRERPRREVPQTVEECVALMNWIYTSDPLHTTAEKWNKVADWYSFDAEKTRAAYDGDATVSEIVLTSEEPIPLALPLNPTLHKHLKITHDRLMWHSGGGEDAEHLSYLLMYDNDWLPMDVYKIVRSYLKPTARCVVVQLRANFYALHTSLAVSTDETPRVLFDQFVAEAKTNSVVALQIQFGHLSPDILVPALANMCDAVAAARLLNKEDAQVIDLDRPWCRQAIMSTKTWRLEWLTTGDQLHLVFGQPTRHPPAPEDNAKEEIAEVLSDADCGLEPVDPASCVLPE